MHLSITTRPKRIRNHCTGFAAKQYWEQKGRIGNAVASEISWESTGCALKETNVERRRFITKHSTGWCGVNKNLERWKLDNINYCPRCFKSNETAKHVWMCQSTSARKVWQQGLDNLEVWMKREKPVQKSPQFLFRDYEVGRRPTAPLLFADLDIQDYG